MATTPSTATKRRRSSCGSAAAAAEAKQVALEHFAGEDAAVAASPGAHAFRVSQHRIACAAQTPPGHRGCRVPHERPELAPWNVDPANTPADQRRIREPLEQQDRHASCAEQQPAGRPLPAVCYGFFRRRSTEREAAQTAYPLPPTGYTPPNKRTRSGFSRTKGVHGVTHWCLTSKNLAQEREELESLYRSAKEAGFVVDPERDDLAVPGQWDQQESLYRSAKEAGFVVDPERDDLVPGRRDL